MTFTCDKSCRKAGIRVFFSGELRIERQDVILDVRGEPVKHSVLLTNGDKLSSLKMSLC